MTITIAIPTYRRGEILVTTLEHLLRLDPAADEIVVVDQTPEHPPSVHQRLDAWNAAGTIRLLHLSPPSIPRAMNTALRAASGDRVLFLDDDIVPSAGLIAEHERALAQAGVWAVAGQVLQPGEVPQHHPSEELHRGLLRDLEFPFNHDQPEELQNVMAGNLCVDRRKALSIGGFDENFTAVAYRFETDFALRLTAAGGRIRYAPAASIRHLRLPTGGTRTFGDHRSSPSPAHATGDYYFARMHVPHFWRYAMQRLRRNVLTRWHLRHPWAIPPKVVGELRGLIAGVRLAGRRRSSRE